MLSGSALGGGLSPTYQAVQVGGKTVVTLASDVLKNGTIEFQGVLTADCTVTFQVAVEDAGLQWEAANATTGAFNLFCQGPLGAAYNLASGGRTSLQWTGAALIPVDSGAQTRSAYGQVTIPSTASPTVNLTSGQANPTVISLLGNPSGAPVVNTNVLSSYWLFDNRTGAPVTIKYQGGLGVTVPANSNGFVFIDSAGAPTLSADLANVVLLAPPVAGRNTIQPTVDSVDALTVKRHSFAHSADMFLLVAEDGLPITRLTALGAWQGRNGLGTDQNGGDLILAAGQSTGIGSTGVIRFRCDPSSFASGSGQNALYDKLTLTDSFGNVLRQHSGSFDILQVLSHEPADVATQLRRVPGVFFRGHYFSGGISNDVDVGTDLEVISTAPTYAWRVITGGSPRIWVNETGRVSLASTNRATARLLVEPEADATPAISARQHSATQTQDLFRAEDSAGAAFSRFDPAGYFITKKNAAPADAALAAGEVSLWLDPTNAAGKLMVKAKTSNGTVVTAAIALA